MPTVTTSSVIRSILTEDVNLTAADVIREARRRGLKASDESIKGLVYNIRGEVKRAGAARNGSPAKAPPVAPARPAARPPATTPRVLPQPSRPAAPPAPRPAAGPVPADVAAVLANVALVGRVAGLCGGPGNARQVAEAVRACGGVDEFLQHLDLVAGITAGHQAA